MHGLIVVLILTVCLTVVMASVASYYYKAYWRLSLEKHRLNLNLLQNQNVLEALPQPWCCWIDGETIIHTSHIFKNLFRLDPTYQLQLHDIAKIFGESALSPFQRALQHIISFGGNFTLELNIFDNTKHFEVYGCCLPYTPPPTPGLYRRPLGTQQMIVLNFRDISQRLSEQSKFNSIHQTKNHELEMLRILTDVSPIALWYRNTNGRIQYCNLAYAGALETSINRVIAENRELVDRYGEVSTYELSRRALQQKEKITIRTHIVIAGQRRFLELAEIPIPDSSQTVGYAMDITEIEDIDKEMQQTKQSHTEVFNYLSTPLAIYRSDTRLEFFNSAYRTMFELDENWLLTKPTLGEIMEHLREKRKMPEYTNFQAHKRGRIELFNTLMEPLHEILHQPDGITYRLVIAPMPTGGLVYLFDNITDKLALERRYNTLTAVQKETIDHLYEGIIVFGTDYRLRLSNPAMEYIWGLKPNDRTVGIHINEILKEVSRQFKDSRQSKAWRSKMLDVISRRNPERQRISLKKDKMLEYSYVPLPDGSHLLSFIDISDTWRFERSLKERNQTLEREDRLKSDFISHVSYELRSPLNTIAGFSEILLNQYFGALNEKQLDYCKGISESTDRLMNLINDMVDLASIESGKLSLNYQDVQIEHLLGSVLVLVQNRANDQGLELVVENHVASDVLRIDLRRLKHGLFNLLTNAIKFTPNGGRITLSALKSKTEGAIDIVVEDTGIGISNEDQSRLFNQSLLNLTGQSGTSGLGLTLAKSLIELHAGQLTLESEVNKGTRVRCTIPMLPEIAQAATPQKILSK
jgi:signal transduction histidine kinase